MSGLELFSSDHEGYKPMVDFGSWRVAFSNGPKEYKKKEIGSLSRHVETDEVFTLIKGSCMLITAGNGNEPGEVVKTWMETGIIYNVTKGTWHNSIVLPGTTVMIVENSDTGSHNSESKDIREKISI